jgi:hypothetical protein
MTINGDPNPSANNSSEDDNVEDDTYMPSPRARPHGKGLASASGSRAVRDDEEIKEEDDGGNENDGAEGDDNEEDKEVFDVEEINPTSYIHMGTPVFWLPIDLDWRKKISYKGKIDLVREKRKKIQGLLKKNLELTIHFIRHFSRTSMSL